MSKEDKQLVVCVGVRGRLKSDSVELSRDIHSSLSHPTPRSGQAVRHFIPGLAALHIITSLNTPL